MKGKQSDLLEAARSTSLCNAFPRRQLAGGVLFLDASLAAAEFKLRALSARPEIFSAMVF